MNINKIALKLPTSRDEAEKQFLIMFLKLKVPFFKEFDKKTLRMVMDRCVTTNYKRSQVVSEFEADMNKMHMLLSGKLGKYTGYRSNDHRKVLDTVVEEKAIIGEQGMT